MTNKEATDIIKNRLNTYYCTEEDLQALDLAIKALNTQESLEKKIEFLMKERHGEWIPISERLPEEIINPKTNDFEEVLCTTIWGDVRHYKYGKPIGHDEAHFWYGWGIMDKDVIAWQPLPEPYTKGGAE